VVVRTSGSTEHARETYLPGFLSHHSCVGSSQGSSQRHRRPGATADTSSPPGDMGPESSVFGSAGKLVQGPRPARDSLLSGLRPEPYAMHTRPHREWVWHGGGGGASMVVGTLCMYVHACAPASSAGGCGMVAGMVAPPLCMYVCGWMWQPQVHRWPTLPVALGFCLERQHRRRLGLGVGLTLPVALGFCLERQHRRR